MERRYGAPSVKVGIETIPVAQLCPAKLARAIYREMLKLMGSHPETFPELSMCTQTRRPDMALMLAYGSERMVVPLEDARRYLGRLLDGHTGRHDDPEED